MGYLRELPNVRYQSPLSHKNSSTDFIIIKNLFRKNKILDWLSKETAVFNKFIIAEGARPDTVAEDLYGDPLLDYIVIISCGITNIRNEWPLSNKELYEFVEDKYGTNMNAIHHYETLEVRDAEDRLILPAGQRVEHNVASGRPFQIDGPAALFGGSANKWYTKTGGVVQVITGERISPVGGISNFDYETQLNEDKRLIRPLKREYVQMFVNDFRRIMKYDRNTQYLSDTLISTENTNLIQ
tara:strand:- start:164 stop:886 length:723 start_codon:yes stop_codon:yes gene_type:complete